MLLLERKGCIEQILPRFHTSLAKRLTWQAEKSIKGVVEHSYV